MGTSVSELAKVLRYVGLKNGDTVMVHARTYNLGGIRPLEILETILAIIGYSGTIVVPTFTTSFGRTGNKFVLESDETEMGELSRAVLRHPDRHRTLHPIHSCAAIGARAKELTANHPRWNVGHDTIWDRLHKAGAKNMAIGIPIKVGCSFAHHCEYLACVPYLYNKILSGEVWDNGIRVLGDFFMAVRYLDCEVIYDLGRAFEFELKITGQLEQFTIGNGIVNVALMSAVFDTCMAGLKADPYFLLAKPPKFTKGKIPLDGPTSQKETEKTPSYYRRYYDSE